MKTRLNFRALLLASTLSLAALSAEAETLRVAMGYDPVSLDPIATSDNGSIWTQLLIYDTLVRPDATGTKLEPGLAESWTVSDDGLTIRFKLRDAKFSDGTPVTAEDVQFSIERAASEESGWGRFYRPITRFEIPNPREIVMHLSEPFTPAFNNLALFAAAILPKAALEAKGAAFFDAPVGSGPFVLKKWTRGASLELVKNPYYWQAGKPAVDEAVLEVVTEPSARVIKLEAGEVDVALDPPLNQLAALKAEPGITTGSVTPYRADFVQLNTRYAPLGNEKVRQALNYAIDKTALIKGVLYGEGTPAASAMPVMAYADPALTPYPYDPAKAKALLAEAGYPEGFEAEMLVDSGIATQRNTAIALQAMLAQVGVKVKIQMLESGTQWETTKAGGYQMSLSYTTSDTIDPDQIIGFVAVNPERANAYHTEWKNERLNALYAQERKTVNGPERGAMFREMIQILHDGAPFLFLYHPATVWAEKDYVKGFSVLPTSNFRLEDVTIAK
ncbi:ABC transporter substrate-binding protein [Sinirhodobacter huangdaonensis]|uniref:ABC transporter substrate-binding protein n=1 Tax=Paenirhodobacter huangdaonensis TaxID=2501515 RepID=A0A3S3LZ43_9RHOB|nr:ABC transporter substrate-binding protein [Sinirhodobacter huangdaonensis]RWR52049.1 ABC transporter substrate-binding protein [Sinirhodobacter huangdaonensis]